MAKMNEQKASMVIVTMVAVVAAVALLLLISGSFDFSNDISGQAIKVTPTKSTTTISDVKTDTDGDGLTDSQEIEYGTDKTDPDSDNDGFTDGYEVNSNGTDPDDADTDDDGLNDYEEIKNSADPNDKDTDGDGLKDGEEVNTYDSWPYDTDSDNDGYSDYYESITETDLVDASDYPSTCYEQNEGAGDGVHVDIYQRGTLIIASESSEYEEIKERCTIKDGSTCLNSLTHTWETCYCYSSDHSEKETCGAEAVAEHYCFNGNPYYIDYNCPSGYSCSNGACVVS